MTAPNAMADGDVLAVILVDALIKGTILIAAAGFAGPASRRASAASRHLIGVLAMMGLVTLPLLSAGLPRWRVAVLPASDVQRTESRDEPLERREEAASVEEETEGQPHAGKVGRRNGLPEDRGGVEISSGKPSSRVSISNSAENKSIGASSSVDEAGVARSTTAARWTPWLSLLWAAGFIVVMSRWCLSWWSAVRLVRSGRSNQKRRWAELLEELRSDMRIGRMVRLIVSEQATMPMTAGVLRPVVVLPVLSDSWSEQQRRVVLTHELAHVQRWDTLSQFLSRLGCALHWFNPAVWALGRWTRAQCEQAADDVVVAQGTPPAEYAKSLVHLAEQLKRGAHPVGQAAISMAPTPKSLFERRLMMIIDTTQNRSGANRLSIVIGVAGLAALVVPLAAVQPAVRAADDTITSAEKKQQAEGPDDGRESATEATTKDAPERSGESSGGIRGGEVVERELYKLDEALELADGESKVESSIFLDLDTGELIATPESLLSAHRMAPSGELMEVAQQQKDRERKADDGMQQAIAAGADVWANVSGGNPVLSAIGDARAKFVPLRDASATADALPKFSANQFETLYERLMSTPGGGSQQFTEYSGWDALPETFLFKTRDGSRGVLQVVAALESPPGVRIRYRLAADEGQGADEGDAPGDLVPHTAEQERVKNATQAYSDTSEYAAMNREEMEKVVKHLEEIVNIRRESLQQMHRLFRQGTTTPHSVNEARVALAEAEIRLLKARAIARAKGADDGADADDDRDNTEDDSANAPPVALDGYSVVSLIDADVWVKGDPRLFADYDGSRYLFLGGKSTVMAEFAFRDERRRLAALP